MPITIYKNILIARTESLGLMQETTKTDLTQLNEAAAQADDSLLKPIRRNDGETAYSLFNIGQIPSVKLASLGKGGYGKVYLHVDGFFDTEQDHVYAVKVVPLDAKTEKGKQNLRRGVEHEIKVATALGQYIRGGERINKKGIVKIYSVFTFINGLTLDETLQDFKEKKKQFTAKQAVMLMQRICEQLARVHAIDYAHGDLHTGNIMINLEDQNNPAVRLIDFNLSRPPYESYYISMPIKEYDYPHIPPECCGRNEMYFTSASDVYALGAVFNSILAYTEKDTDAYTKDLRNNLKALIYKMRAAAKDTRPSLQSLAAELQVQLNLNRTSRPLLHSRSPIEPAIPLDVKAAAIWALEAYASGWTVLRSITEAGFSQKSTFMTSQVSRLQGLTLKSEFIKKLTEGCITYIKQFVVPALAHYVSEKNLGRGLDCFLQAIKACGDDVNKTELMQEIGRNLPKESPATDQFMDKLQNILNGSESSIETKRRRERV